MPCLYVVATPIGNLSEASPRMLDTLRSVGLIAAEDTRVTGNLLRHFGIRTPMISLHRHNEGAKADGIIRQMAERDIDAALVTDAGTPAISDPGNLLVRAAAEAGIAVLPVSGPTAIAAALSISGFDAREFSFFGFLPRERNDIRKKMISICESCDVAVLYESPHRIINLIEVIAEVAPGCAVCCCCDLTKLYELTLRGTPEAVLCALRANPKAAKGEYCVVLDLHEARLEPASKALGEVSVEALLFDRIIGGESVSGAMDALVSAGFRKNELKRAALALKPYLQRPSLE